MYGDCAWCSLSRCLGSPFRYISTLPSDPAAIQRVPLAQHACHCQGRHVHLHKSVRYSL